MPSSSLTVHRADWLLPPLRPPVQNGALLLSGGGTLLEAGPWDALRGALEAPLREGSCRVYEHGHAVLFPGLVNAHVHLELSHLRGLVARSEDKSSGSGLVPWLRRFLEIRRQFKGNPDARSLAMRDAATEMKSSGTAFVGDISNTLESWDVLAEAGFGGVVFHEIYHSVPPQEDAASMAEAAAGRIAALRSATGLRASLAPHAPYTVSAALFDELRAWADASGEYLSLHLAEDAGENALYREGRGEFREWFEEAGLWPWPPGFRPAACGSTAALAVRGFWGPRVLAVHGTHLDMRDAATLRAAGTSLCLCPRSNAYVGCGEPDLKTLLASELNLALGTDSLASNHDLNLRREGAALLGLAEKQGADLSASKVLEMCTVNGAGALGLGRGAVSLSKGGTPAVMRLPCPPDLRNPTEWFFGDGADARAEPVTAGMR